MKYDPLYDPKESRNDNDQAPIFEKKPPKGVIRFLQDVTGITARKREQERREQFGSESPDEHAHRFVYSRDQPKQFPGLSQNAGPNPPSSRFDLRFSNPPNDRSIQLKSQLAQVPLGVIGVTPSLARDAYKDGNWEFGKNARNPATGKAQPVLRTFPDKDLFPKERLDRLAKHLNEKGIAARVEPSASRPGVHYLAIPAAAGQEQLQTLDQVQRIMAETIKAAPTATRNAAPVRRQNFSGAMR